MATEKLKFKLELYATVWDKPPVANIKINEKSYFNKEITSTEYKPTIIEFEHELEDGLEVSKCNLIIDRLNKDAGQVVIKDGKIIKDQLLHIKSIEINEIDIGSLLYQGVYRPEYPEPWATQQAEAGNKLPETVKNITQLGHNGTWTFTCSSSPPNISGLSEWRHGCNRKDLQKKVKKYILLQNDGPRNTWYLKSFADCVEDKNCVEIGTGLGILSSIAIGFNPKSITAYERDNEAYKIASHCLNKKINVRHDTIENLYQSPLDPTPDIIFHEIMGDRIWDEGCNLFLPYGIDNWQKPTWCALPGEFITEIHVSKEKSKFSNETDPNVRPHPSRSITIDPGVSVDLEWLQKLKNTVYPMFDCHDENLRLFNTDFDSAVFKDSKPVAKFLLNVNKGTITKNDTEVISFSDITWSKDTAIELNFDVEKDSFIFFRFGIKHKTSILYLDQGDRWGVVENVLQVKKDTNVKIDQKLRNGEIGIEVEGKRHII